MVSDFGKAFFYACEVWLTVNKLENVAVMPFFQIFMNGIEMSVQFFWILIDFFTRLTFIKIIFDQM